MAFAHYLEGDIEASVESGRRGVAAAPLDDLVIERLSFLSTQVKIRTSLNLTDLNVHAVDAGVALASE